MLIHQPAKLRSIVEGFSFLRSPLVRLVFAIGVLFVGQVAKAETCGHYLLRNGMPVSVQHQTAALPVIPVFERGDSLRHLHADLNPEMIDDQSPFKLPCNSPACRGRSTPLAPSPAPTTLTRQTDPAFLLAEMLVNNGVFGPAVLPESDSGERILPADIFRPPQA